MSTVPAPVPVVSIRRDEAKRRWASSQPVAFAGTPGWFDTHLTAQTWTPATLDMTWAELVTGGNNSAARAFAKPTN